MASEGLLGGVSRPDSRHRNLPRLQSVSSHRMSFSFRILGFWVFWKLKTYWITFAGKLDPARKKPNWWRCEPGSGEICKLTMDRLAPILALFCVSARIFPLINWRFHSALPVELFASAYFGLTPTQRPFWEILGGSKLYWPACYFLWILTSSLWSSSL